MKQVIEIFNAAGYNFIGQNPKGRLLFKINDTEKQFWITEKTTLKNVMSFILENEFERGRKDFKNEIKNLLGY